MDNPFLATPTEPGNVVLDIDGVVFLGGAAIPGAGHALQHLAASGWHIVFATNNATRTRTEIAGRIAALTGYEATAHQIVTSAVAAASMLSPADDPIYIVGEQGLASALEESGHDLTQDSTKAATVIVALDRSFTYDKMAAAAGAIRRGARFIATNTDVTFPTPNGQVPGAGSLVAAVAAAAGCEPEAAGKPHMAMVEAVRQALGPGETWVVGDRPETDLAFAAAAGWRSVLALSGVVSDPAEVPNQWTPDMVVDSIADLVPSPQ